MRRPASKKSQETGLPAQNDATKAIVLPSSFIYSFSEPVKCKFKTGKIALEWAYEYATFEWKFVVSEYLSIDILS